RASQKGGLMPPFALIPGRVLVASTVSGADRLEELRRARGLLDDRRHEQERSDDCRHDDDAGPNLRHCPLLRGWLNGSLHESLSSVTAAEMEQFERHMRGRLERSIQVLVSRV